MKFLLIGNPCFNNALRSLGHEVKMAARSSAYPSNIPIDIPITALPTALDTILTALPQNWQPDWVVLCDESTFPLVSGLESSPYPVAWYTIDSHIHFKWHPWYASVFDYIFVAHKDYLKNYRIAGRKAKVEWLPVFSNPTKDKYLNIQKIYDISFVGTMNPILNPKRVEFIEALKKKIPLNVAQGDYVEIFNQSKMVVNQCVLDDLNFRVFEAMACGPLLLTEDTDNGLKELFTDKKQLVLYQPNNVDNVVELFNHYMENEEERKKIAQCGMSDVQTKHTSHTRAMRVVEALSTIPAVQILENRNKNMSEIKLNTAKVMQHVALVYLDQSETEVDPARSEGLLSVCKNYLTIYRDLSTDI
ncbi:MAG: glycosyltransferase family 1 protein [Magnetococcales bacterium]|nr:glycosyltransferase family 1 protein [Magnetococcales bacterium]